MMMTPVLSQPHCKQHPHAQELSAALDKSIGVASRGSIALGAAMRQSYTSSASGDDTALLQGQIRTLYTKLDVYRKTNDQLRHQLEVTSTADHVVQLENALTEQTRQNAQLVKELNAQKKAMSLARREDRARDEHEAPETVEMRTNGLIDENRALRERVRDLTARVVAHEKAAVAKHEQYHKAATAARQFEEQVRKGGLGYALVSLGRTGLF